jgi:hypothetical protein
MRRIRSYLLALPVVAIASPAVCQSIGIDEINRTLDTCRSSSKAVCMCPSRETELVPCSIERPDNVCGPFPWGQPDKQPTWNACMAQCKAENAKREAYNRLVASCTRDRDTSHPPTRPVQPAHTQAPARPPTSQSPLSSALAGARQRAQDSAGENQRASAEMDQLKRDRDAEQEKWRKAQQAADDARRRADKIEEDRRRRELADANKWHCFGQDGNVNAGFQQCQQACAPFWGALQCHSVCYASNTGSIASGQSCFKEP